jgi:dTDP-4-amino-4,6-dideoxygalactose transaminase
VKDIRIFDLHYNSEFKEKFHKYCDEILEEGYLTNHVFVKKFEESFAHFSDSKYSLATTSGTSALETSLRAINVENKEVILPTNTFIATAVAALNAGASLKILDVEKPYYTLSIEELKKNISKETGAVIIVHIAGHVTPRINEIKELCDSYDVPLIEDCAHAHGASFKNTKAGNFGDFGCFSHFTTKIMSTGEGGSIICNDKNLYDKIESIRQFGKDKHNPISHTLSGSNFKITEFQAALGLLELERVQERINKRRLLALRYQENLQDSNWIPFKDNEDMCSSYYKQVLVANKDFSREELTGKLSKKGISLTGGVYFIPLHMQPSMRKHLSCDNFNTSDHFSKYHICPPCYPELSLDDVDRVCEALRKEL